MNGLDLFSGIGGITIALKDWVRPIIYCEKDRYAQGVLLSRMATGDIPTAPIWDDVCTFDGTPWVGAIDIIYGGFPCQDISVAGNGAGLEGKRSGLFFQIVRLAEEIKPSFIFLENVPAIRTRGLDSVGKELAELGYDCRWGVISAYDMGAPHKRERWFLLAHNNGERDELRNLLSENEKQGRSEKQHQNTSNQSSDAGSNAEVLANTDGLRKLQSSGIKSECWQRIGDGSWWAIEPNVDRVVNGLPFRVDRIRGLGNAVVPAQAREAFKRLMGIK